MDSFEWEIFKRTGHISHYLLLKEAEEKKIFSNQELAEEFYE